MAAAKRASDVPRQSPLAAELLARFGGVEELTVERLESELPERERYDIVAALSELQKAGAGAWVGGRKGGKARFVWSRREKAVSQAQPSRRAEPRAKRRSVPGSRSVPDAHSVPGVRSAPTTPRPASTPRRSAPATPRSAPATPRSPSAGRATVTAAASRSTAQQPAPSASERRDLERATVPLLEHSFHIREGVVTNLRLPADVTKTEIQRLCQFLQAIPFS